MPKVYTSSAAYPLPIQWVAAQQPLDDRLVVLNQSDLLSQATWLHNNIGPCTHHGMIVAVVGDSDASKNGLYRLGNANHYEYQMWDPDGVDSNGNSNYGPTNSKNGWYHILDNTTSINVNNLPTPNTLTVDSYNVYGPFASTGVVGNMLTIGDHIQFTRDNGNVPPTIINQLDSEFIEQIYPCDDSGLTTLIQDHGNLVHLPSNATGAANGHKYLIVKSTFGHYYVGDISSLLTSSTGVNTLVALQDTYISGEANGQYLRYVNTGPNAGTWQNVPFPTNVSTFTNDAGYITLQQVPAQVNSDWNATAGVAQILNKPTNVSAFSNDAGYITLSQVPTQVNADWNATSGAAEILHKPTIPTVPTNVSAFTNDANYITSADIPANVSAFTNDAGYITAAQVPSPVQSNWNETDNTSDAYIQNKPTIPNAVSGVHDGINWTNITIGNVTKAIPSASGGGGSAVSQTLSVATGTIISGTLDESYTSSLYLSGDGSPVIFEGVSPESNGTGTDIRLVTTTETSGVNPHDDILFKINTIDGGILTLTQEPTNILFPRVRSFSSSDAPNDVFIDNHVSLKYGSPLVFSGMLYDNAGTYTGYNHMFCIGDTMQNSGNTTSALDPMLFHVGPYYGGKGINIQNNPSDIELGRIDLNISPGSNITLSQGNNGDIVISASYPQLATVATSGSYNDLLNTPTIPTVPTNVSSFTNDAGYITLADVSPAVFICYAIEDLNNSGHYFLYKGPSTSDEAVSISDITTAFNNKQIVICILSSELYYLSLCVGTNINFSAINAESGTARYLRYVSSGTPYWEYHVYSMTELAETDQWSIHVVQDLASLYEITVEGRRKCIIVDNSDNTSSLTINFNTSSGGTSHSTVTKYYTTNSSRTIPAGSIRLVKTKKISDSAIYYEIEEMTTS